MATMHDKCLKCPYVRRWHTKYVDCAGYYEGDSAEEIALREKERADYKAMYVDGDYIDLDLC
jgi:hypothetical protein